MNLNELKGSEFKWISPLTDGVSYGIVKNIYKYRYESDIMIESTNGNVYNYSECFFKVDDEFKKVLLDE